MSEKDSRPAGRPGGSTVKATTNRKLTRRCAVGGCCWRGLCPLHDVDERQLDHLVRLVAERPYGRGWTAA